MMLLVVFKKKFWDFKKNFEIQPLVVFLFRGNNLLQIETQKLTFKEQARSKVGSKDYLDHKPGGGDKKVSAQTVPGTKSFR